MEDRLPFNPRISSVAIQGEVSPVLKSTARARGSPKPWPHNGANRRPGVLSTEVETRAKRRCVACPPHTMKTTNLYPIHTHWHPSFRFHGIPKTAQFEHHNQHIRKHTYSPVQGDAANETAEADHCDAIEARRQRKGGKGKRCEAPLLSCPVATYTPTCEEPFCE